MKNILGYRDYFAQKKIKDTIKTSVNYAGENPDAAELFYFFETSKQRTWFVATNKRVFLILDDIRTESVKVNKSYKYNLIYSDGKLNIKVDPNFKTLAGRLIFSDETRGWLYSKSLFSTPDELRNTVESIMKRVA